MTKRLVEIDDDLLERARAATGEPTIRATVEAGLHRLVADDAVRDHIAWLRDGDGLDIDLLRDVREPRIPVDG